MAQVNCTALWHLFLREFQQQINVSNKCFTIIVTTAFIDVQNLLQHYELKIEYTKQKCSENFLTSKVAAKIVDWKALAPHLGMSDADVVAIQRDGVDEDDRRRKLLQRWLQRNGREATYYKLIEAFIDAENRHIADEICKQLAGII